MSDVSFIEIAVKIRVGKLRLLIARLEQVITEERLRQLPLERRHLRELASLPRHHRDPFDALLIAQARVEGMTLLSGDTAFALYDVALI